MNAQRHPIGSWRRSLPDDTLWLDYFTGERLSRSALDELRRRAHIVYEANTAIFEDEQEALVSIGAVSLAELLGAADPRCERPTACAAP